VALQYSNPQICGPTSYKILEGHPFIQIISPADPFTDAWTISVSTDLISDIKVYTATLVASLDKYANATPENLQFTVYISHRCELSELQPITLLGMTFTLGFV